VTDAGHGAERHDVAGVAGPGEATGIPARGVPPVLLLVLATLFWAGNYVIGERVVRVVDPLSLTWLRWLLSAVPLVVLAHLVERPDWPAVLRRWPTLLVMGLVGAAAYPMLLYAALLHTSAVNASVINAINPAVIVLAAALLGQESAGRRSWVGVGAGFVGVLLLLSRGDLGTLLGLRLNTGDLLMLVAVLAWTAYTLGGRRLGLPVLTATAVQVVLVSVVLAPFALGTGLTLPPDGTTWWLLLLIVVFPSIGSYLCWNAAVTRAPAGTAGASMNLVTVFVLAFAALLGQPPTLVQLLGATLVIGGVLLARPRRVSPSRPAR
jgi:drug/metabolite transporter (DMT)-like permease